MSKKIAKSPTNKGQPRGAGPVGPAQDPLIAVVKSLEAQQAGSKKKTAKPAADKDYKQGAKGGPSGAKNKQF